MSIAITIAALVGIFIAPMIAIWWVADRGMK